MTYRLRFARALALLLPGLLGALPAQAGDGPAALVIADDGGLDVSQWRAIRGLALGQLRKKGVNVVEAPDLEGVMPIDAQTILIAQRAGARRIFVLRINGRLGQKVPLLFDEMETPPTVSYSATMTAGTLDDCEQVVPRLVDAVLGHTSVENTAERDSVTKNEARPYNKKSIERFFIVGLPIGLFRDAPPPDDDSWIVGASVSMQWETESFRLGPTGMLAYKGGRWAGGVSADLAWLPLNGQWSPYVGAGLGYFGGYDGGGFGAKGTLGLEFFRLYSIRLNVSVDVLFPFYESTSTGSYKLYPVAHLQFGW